MKRMPLFNSENHMISDGEARYDPDVATWVGNWIWTGGLHGTSAHAVIEDTATHRQELYRVGDEIRGARVAAITWHQVTLARGDAEALALTTFAVPCTLFVSPAARSTS